MLKFKLISGFLLFCFISGAPELWGQFRKAGTTGYAFLEIPVSARMAGMGEISTAMPDNGVQALFSNPGQMGFTSTGHQFYVSYAAYLADTRHQALGYLLNLPNIGAFGISLNYLDMGEMVETTNADPLNPGGNYIVLGQFKADALALGLSYSRRLIDVFAFGITARYIKEQIAQYRSSNVVFDLGMMYLTGFYSLRLGGYIQNLGVDSKYIDDTFKMPMIFRLGLSGEIIGSYDSSHRLTIATEALHPSNYNERVHVGGEYCYQDLLLLRLGYKFNYDLGGFSAGAGFKYHYSENCISVDIAYTDFGVLQSVIRLSLGVSF